MCQAFCFNDTDEDKLFANGEANNNDNGNLLGVNSVRGSFAGRDF